jgi:hypothetical protein
MRLDNLCDNIKSIFLLTNKSILKINILLIKCLIIKNADDISLI